MALHNVGAKHAGMAPQARGGIEQHQNGGAAACCAWKTIAWR